MKGEILPPSIILVEKKVWAICLLVVRLKTWFVCLFCFSDKEYKIFQKIRELRKIVGGAPFKSSWSGFDFCCWLQSTPILSDPDEMMTSLINFYR